MSDKLGLVSFSERAKEANQFYKPYSDETARLIDSEVAGAQIRLLRNGQVRDLIERAYERTHQLLLDNREGVEKVAKELLAKCGA